MILDRGEVMYKSYRWPCALDDMKTNGAVWMSRCDSDLTYFGVHYSFMSDHFHLSAVIKFGFCHPRKKEVDVEVVTLLLLMACCIFAWGRWTLRRCTTRVCERVRARAHVYVRVYHAQKSRASIHIHTGSHRCRQSPWRSDMQWRIGGVCLHHFLNSTSFFRRSFICAYIYIHTCSGDQDGTTSTTHFLNAWPALFLKTNDF